MQKKYHHLGVQLSQSEMKEIKGGGALQPANLYHCYEDGWLYVYCGHANPHPVCGHDYCTVVGLCNPPTFNGINCQ